MKMLWIEDGKCACRHYCAGTCGECGHDCPARMLAGIAAAPLRWAEVPVGRLYLAG